VEAYAVEILPAGAVIASLSEPNIIDPDVVTAAVRTVLGRLGTRPTRLALVLPDSAAKVSLLHFDRIPTRRDDLDQLVRWQLRKSTPFAIEDAAVSYTPGARSTEGGGDFVVVMAKRKIVEEYEGVCAAAGAYAGLIDLTSLSVLNLILISSGTPAKDWLAVYMRPEYTTVAIVRDGHVIFFRNRPEGGEDSLADLVHQTAMYYQDRLEGQRFARVFLGGSGRTPDAVALARRSLDERLDSTVEPIDAVNITVGSDRNGVSAEQMDVLAPLTGILLRAQLAAVTP
jgi:type IV pilus assembly protein PilM